MQDSILTAVIANKDVVCDTTKTQIVDSLSRIISENVTFEALKNSEAFYSSAFDKIQHSFSIFVDKVNITTIIISIVITLIVTIFSTFITIYAQRENKGLKKDFLDSEKRLVEKYEGQKNKIEMWYKNQKESFENWFEKSQIEIKKADNLLELVTANSFIISDQGKRMNRLEEQLDKIDKMLGEKEFEIKKVNEFQDF